MDDNWEAPDLIGVLRCKNSPHIIFDMERFKAVLDELLEARVSPATFIQSIDIYGNPIGVKKDDVASFYITNDLRWRRSVLYEVENTKKDKQWRREQGGWNE